MSYHATVLGWLAVLAACSPPAAEQAAEPMAPDTAAIRAELRAMSDRNQASYLAGDAAGVAANFADSAIAEFLGFPTAVGKAAIESTYVAYFAANKLTVAEIGIDQVSSTGPDRASALGTFHSFGESAGKPVHQWWRYVAAHTKGADGQWRISYIMAFPDSTK
jgi:ketosteroid isomerase-like protein